MKGTVIFMYLAIILIFILYNKTLFIRMLGRIKIRWDQIEECKDWCSSKGLFVTFNEDEKQQCVNKCYNFALSEPISEFACTCLPITNSEYCLYYLHLRFMSVRDAVSTRWSAAVIRKYT